MMGFPVLILGLFAMLVVAAMPVLLFGYCKQRDLIEQLRDELRLGRAHVKLLEAIDTLCREEDDSVILCAANRDGSAFAYTIAVYGKWAENGGIFIDGDSRLACLQQAMAIREATKTKES